MQAQTILACPDLYAKNKNNCKIIWLVSFGSNMKQTIMLATNLDHVGLILISISLFALQSFMLICIQLNKESHEPLDIDYNIFLFS